jgi:hypothetical protein
MAENCELMMKKMYPIEETGTWTDADEAEILEMEDHQDAMQVEFVHFMSRLLAANVPINVAAYRRVRDHLINIVEVLKGEK